MTSVNRRKNSLFGTTAPAKVAGWLALGIAAPLACMTTAQAQTLPSGGIVAAGSATISSGSGTLTVNQSSQNAVLNWQSFSIGETGAVVYVQPNSNSVALNRVVGPDPSAILGSLSSNGKVFLVNPNGIVFGQGANVNVGGLVASTLDLSDADFMNGRYTFSGNGGSVVNEGRITADSGYVALLGGQVDNRGVIRANLGTVALAAGEAITLDVAGDGLLNVAVDKGAIGALVQNGGLLQADGGRVTMTAQAAGALLRTVVNNTGVVEARSLATRDGRILLLGDMQTGTVNVDGVLDASAPDGGNGGFIETSAATVTVADTARITTAAPLGVAGNWLIDPADFIIGAGGNISGATLSKQLVTNNVTISTMPAPGAASGGNGDIFVNDAIAWTASGVPTTLTLYGYRDVNINAPISATKGNLVVCCGRDINVNAALTTVNGSISLNAGRDVRVFHAVTTTDGNIRLCAGHDIHIEGAMTLTDGSTIPAESLGLPRGMTLIAGADGSGPGLNGGSVIFAPLSPPTTVTNAPVAIYYNPVSYSAPTDFSTKFVLTEGAAISQRMLVFPNGDKVFDGTSNAVLAGFNTTAASGLPSGVELVAGPGATAVFDSALAGTGIGITYTGYALAGPDAGKYALASQCCLVGARTRGSITPSSGSVPTPTPTPLPTPTPTPTPGATPGATPGMTPGPNPGSSPGSAPVPGSTPTVVLTPTSTLAAALPPVQQQITQGAAPIVPAAFPTGLTIVAGGVRISSPQLASLEAPLPLEVKDERSVTRQGSKTQGSAFLPTAPAPVVPVYPRKQARH